jgi:hypothetical protein
MNNWPAGSPSTGAQVNYRLGFGLFLAAERKLPSDVALVGAGRETSLVGALLMLAPLSCGFELFPTVANAVEFL